MTTSTSTFQSRKRLYIHKCPLVCLSVTKTHQQLEIIILHHSFFILPHSSFIIHSSFIHPSFILHSSFIHFTAFKLLSLLPYNQAFKISPASFKEPQIRSKLLHRNVSPHFRILRPSRIRWCMSWGNEKNLVALNFALKTDSHVLLSTL